MKKPYVSGIIVKTAEEKLGKRSDDVDIREYLDESP
jgi:hypothetical protein